MSLYDPDPGKIKIPKSLRPYPGLVKAWLRRKGLADPDPDPARRRRRVVAEPMIYYVGRRRRVGVRVPKLLKWLSGLAGVYLGYSQDAMIDSSVSATVPALKGFGTPAVGIGAAVVGSVLPKRPKSMGYVKSIATWGGGGLFAGWLIKKLLELQPKQG